MFGLRSRRRLLVVLWLASMLGLVGTIVAAVTTHGRLSAVLLIFSLTVNVGFLIRELRQRLISRASPAEPRSTE